MWLFNSLTATSIESSKEVSPFFYVPVQAAHVAAEQHQSFNIVYEAAAFKVDVFVLGSSPLDIRQMRRRVAYEIRADPPAALWVTSPEDKFSESSTGSGLAAVFRIGNGRMS